MVPSVGYLLGRDTPKMFVSGRIAGAEIRHLAQTLVVNVRSGGECKPNVGSVATLNLGFLVMSRFKATCRISCEDYLLVVRAVSAL